MIAKTKTVAINGKTADVYTLTNDNGVEVDIFTFGARITRISVPDKNGAHADVIVGEKAPEDYLTKPNVAYFGATIGRYGNRIGGARFVLGGKEYRISANEKGNTLHGGTSGFDQKVWNAEICGERLVLRLTSADGDEGFPGEMKVEVAFSLSEDNALAIEYKAQSDKDTVCNLTNHSYFNLGGGETVLDHELYINAHAITDVDGELIPTGELIAVKGTAYDFSTPKKIGKDVFSDEKLIAQCGGYDFNYVLTRKTPCELEHCASVCDEESGRKMDCYTTLPAVQLYTGCGMDGLKGKKDYVRHGALCLETQGYPDAPNHTHFPSTVLKKGETYQSKTVYRFSVVK